MGCFGRKTKIQKKLLHWFKKNKRDLPWRKTEDPYAIWISEIMLQQTQVATVIPYYEIFLKTFPTIRYLAKANLSKVLKVWEGLGYYSRARNLHQASKIIANHSNGKIPDKLKDLLNLPGIGRYTAGAILSIAYNKKVPILDGNVKRVLSRLFAVLGHPKKTEEFLWPLSESLIPKGSPGAFNQALMDLGSIICTPKNPNCLGCPLKNLCQGYLSGKPESYPLRSVKKKVPHIEAIAAVIKKDGKVLLRQRPPKGLLGGLWEFPNWKIEEKRRLRLGLRLRNYIKKKMGMNVEVKESIGTFHQTYSHFKLTLQVLRCHFLNSNRHIEGNWIPIKILDQFAMSRIDRRIANALSEVK